MDENCKNKMEIIKINYNSFMKFSIKQQIKINEVFNLNKASYLLNFIQIYKGRFIKNIKNHLQYKIKYF